MATLDPAALERELEALRRQRYEASQRVRAARQPPIGPASQLRNAIGEPSGARPLLGNGRFGPERGFGGPSPREGGGPRAAGFRDGPMPARLGGGPPARGPLSGGYDGPPRGRFDGGASGRPPREYGEYGRDRDGNAGGGSAGGAAVVAPTRRRAVLSMVVSEKEPQRDAGVPEDAEHEREPDQEHERGHGWDRDVDRGSDRWPRGRGHGGDRQDWAWGRNPEEERHLGDDSNDDRGSRGLKRPAPGPAPTGAGGATPADDPDSRKRTRRLLGRALLGTLQKFRQEDAQFQASDAATRRAELARKAEEKSAAESERLRRQAAEERSRKRQVELEALMDLNVATDIKVLELLYAKKVARRRALGAFLRADGVPAPPGTAAAAAAAAGAKGAVGGSAVHVQPQPVYWLPASHCPATLAVKERQEGELRDWEESMLAELELEKDGLRQRAQARRVGISERRQRAAEARAAGHPAAGGAEEEAEDHEALEDVELDAHHEEKGAEAEPAGGAMVKAEPKASARGTGEEAEEAAEGDKEGRGGEGAAGDAAAKLELADTEMEAAAAVAAASGDDSDSANADDLVA